MIKIFLKKFKIVNFFYEFFLSLSENFFLIISKVGKKLLTLKIFRRLAFNLQSRNKHILLDTNYGMYIVNTSSRIIGKKSYYNNIPYSTKSVEKVLKILNKENINFDCFVDIGANIGTSSISAAFINKNTNFLCIEGSEENFDLLKKNVKINNLENRFELHNTLVGSKDNPRLFTEFKEEKGCSRIFENKEELERYKKKFGFKVHSVKEVITKKIETILKENLDKKLFFWIDIEGLDLEILNSDIVKNHSPIFFEFNPTFLKLKYNFYKNNVKELEERFLEMGYKYYFLEARNFKKEEINKSFLLDTVDFLGENKSATNVLVI
jgi:FkbM family methyltransferase